ncbi:MAG: sigma-70 family RNA polymerase sigma factor [Phycisphaerae bacterium]
MQDRSDRINGQAAEDARLVEEVLSGQSAGFDALVRRYQRRAYAVAYRLLSNREDAADVAQDALLKAYQSLDQLADRSRFGSWLMRIVSNLALNYRRSRAASAMSGLDDTVEASIDPRGADGRLLTTSGTPAADRREQELKKAMAAAIADLSEPQRQSLVMSSMAGIPQKEVADMLECSVEMVKWNVFQARKALKQTLAQYLESEQD